MEILESDHLMVLLFHLSRDSQTKACFQISQVQVEMVSIGKSISVLRDTLPNNKIIDSEVLDTFECVVINKNLA